MQSVLESKQAAEAHRLFTDIKKNLASNSFGSMNAAPQPSQPVKIRDSRQSTAQPSAEQQGEQDEKDIAFQPSFMTSDD